MSAIGQALRAGYQSSAILQKIKQKYPKYADNIDTALRLGYHADYILDKFNDGKDTDENEMLQTPYQRGRSNIAKSRKRNAMQLGGAIAGVGAGVYGLTTAGAARGAIQPSQILGQALRRTPQRPQAPGGATINAGSRAQLAAPQKLLPSPQATQAQPAQIGYNPKQPLGPRAPKKPPGNLPSGPTITPPYEHDPSYNVSLVKNMGLDKKLNSIVGSGLRGQAIEQVVRETLPKSKLAILEKAEGGLPQLLEDYLQVVQKEKSRQNKNQALSKFNDRLKKSLLQQETDRFQDQYAGQMQQARNEPLVELQEETSPELAEEANVMAEEPLFEQEQIEQQARRPIATREKVHEAAFGREPLPRLEDINLRKEAFAIADYKKPGEDKKSFLERKKVNDAINKTAKLITEGKSFLDLLKELPPEKRNIEGLSVAADVLRFMAGIPNVYDPLLDNKEKQELFDGLMERGDITVEGRRPTEGEQNVYGAPMTPNLVWNMLILVEPSLQEGNIPRLTGFEKTKDNAKMRRMLTHSVYRALSGKGISTNLADKIEKISVATAGMDAIIKAIKAGNLRRSEMEMERLMDDKEFAEALRQVVDPDYIDPSVFHLTEEEAEEDKKLATYYKARATREKKKKEKIDANERSA